MKPLFLGQFYRKSIRLKDHNYSQPGEYFVTVCTNNGESRFGEVTDGRMYENEFGSIIRSSWLQLPGIYPGVMLDEFIIMPNHFHGILIIAESVVPSAVGAGSPRPAGDGVERQDMPTGFPDIICHDGGPRCIQQGGETPPLQGERDHAGRFKKHGNVSISTHNLTLGQFVARFKYETTRDVNLLRHTPGVRLWQRDFYDRVIRSDKEFQAIQDYILMNPLKWTEDEFNQ
ncbi:MAG TPA: hypothetical protein VN397_03265 [Candidatus Methylomirabilis sp.]|nr:hypothetical protein [Candidatus Methylomirabilis sp.]